MRTLFKVSLLFLCLAATAPVALGQTTNVEATTTTTNIDITPLFTGSNYWFLVDGMYSEKNHQLGGGLAIGYKATDFLMPCVRGDYFDRKFFMASGGLQLQPPQKWLGKIPVTPIALAMVGTPLSGGGDANGTPVGIAGVGAYVRFDWLGNNWFCKHAFLAGDYETWTGLSDIGYKTQVRGALGVTLGW